MATSVNLDISQQLDITCRRGDTFALTLTFTDSNGDPLDLGEEPGTAGSNYDFSMDVRESDTDDANNAVLSTDTAAVASGSVSLMTISRVTPDGSDGKIIIEASASVMGGILGGAYVYDLQAEYLNSAGDTTKIETWLYGSFIVNEDVTIDVG